MSTTALDPSVGAAESAAHPALAALESAWRALAQTAGGPIEGFAWADACAAAGGGREVRVEAVRRGEAVVALAPFEIRRVRGVRRRIMLGVDRYHEPMDALALDADAARELALAIARRRTPVELGRLPAASAFVPLLRDALGARWLVREQVLGSCPYIDLDSTWEHPESHLTSGRRSDLRRARRRAESLGRVESEFVRPAPGDVDALLDEALAIEARSWKGEAGTALARVPEMEAFYRAYAHAAAREGALRVGFLRIDGRGVAMEIAALARGGAWLLKIGHDAEFARCSPGNLLLRDSIAEAAREGLSTYEFLGESQPWITVWTQAERETVRIRAFPVTQAGLTALAADAAAAAARRAASRGRRPFRALRRTARRAAEKASGPIARRFLVGQDLTSALDAEAALAHRGLLSSIAFWDGRDDAPRGVADRYLAAIDGLEGRDPGDYLSIKLPSLGFENDLVGEVLARGARAGRRVHFDALGIETADRTRAAVDRARLAHPGLVSTTLPGRWARSVDDAGWACDAGIPVRVVKGEWPDPGDPGRDPRTGYLEVIDRLAGRAAEVLVATHDLGLARDALGRLAAAGTPCTLELLYGMHTRGPLALARELDVPVRVYLPYGSAYGPYVLSSMRRHPLFGLRLLRDLVVPRRRP